MELLYTAEHEWVAVEGRIATIGITDHAQSALGDLVYVQLPEPGSPVTRGAVAGVVESVKAASDLYAPLTGRVVEINSTVVENPALINMAPMGRGWLFKIEFVVPEELTLLLNETAYRELAR